MAIKRNNDDNSEIDNNQFPDHIPAVALSSANEQIKKDELRKLAKELRKSGGKVEPIIITTNGTIKKASELNMAEKKCEIVRCTSDPIYFIETYLTIFDQTQGLAGRIVPFKLFPFQRKLIKAYLSFRYNIANKYRQAGISTATCAFIAWYVMFNSNRTAAIVADKLETARDELMNDVVEFIEGCPEWLKPKTGKSAEKNYKDTQKLKRYDNNSALGAFSAKSGLRGTTPTLLFWDETAWTEKSDKFWTAARPTMSTGGSTIMVSCVTKDTFLCTDKGIKQIKDFIPNEELGAHIIDEYNILGKDKLRKGNVFFNNGYVDTLKIKSTYSELESSLNHKYWAYKIRDKKYDIYKASDLELGDYISVQYGMNIWGNNDDCFDFKPTLTRNTKNIFNPKAITTDLAYFIGLYISEGYMYNAYRNGVRQTTQITLTCGDSLKHVFDKLGFSCYFDGIHYTISSKNMGEFFEYLGFDLSKKAKQKIIPTRLLEMSKENIVAMIQGIMDGDGWSTYNEKKNKLRVGIGLSSKELINQLRIILGNFGVLTEYNESLTPRTKKVKVTSMCYKITANNSSAIKYLDEIGFRFERKQIKKEWFKPENITHAGVFDNIPNGGQIVNDIYGKIKKYGKLLELNKSNIKIIDLVQKSEYLDKPSSRKVLLRLIEHEKDNLDDNYLKELSCNISPNIQWVKINSIEKSKDWTYDFSLPNFPIELNEFNHSVAYNQIVAYQTPSGLDPVFYKTFEGARKKEEKNNFNAIELWWYNDPRYNKGLVWLKNKNKDTEIKLVDDNWTDEYRIKLMDDGWEASSPWFEEQVRDANGDMKKIAQEILCVGKDSIVTIRDAATLDVINLSISELYNNLPHLTSSININSRLEIFTTNGYSKFYGVDKKYKNNGFKVSLATDDQIVVSEDHIFLANGKNMPLNSLIPDVSYLTTIYEDSFVKSIEKCDETEYYDIIDSKGCEYFANNISNHNCSFLGSGDNFIDEEYLKRIQDHEIKTPIRQEYTDRNMWIFEDPIPEEQYVLAVDASPGHGEDNSTINILKRSEYIEKKMITKNGKTKEVKLKKFKIEQVAEYYGKIVPQGLAEIVYQYGKAYNNAYVVVDITGGYGVQAVEKLLEIGYDNVHYAEVSHKPSRDRLQGYIKKGQKSMTDGTVVYVDLIPGFFIGNNRASVLLELQRSIHLEDIIIRSTRLLMELKTFVTVAGNRVADHKRSFHDDSIMGLSIGLYVINFDMARFKQSNSTTEQMLKSILSANDIKAIGEQRGEKPIPKISPNSSSPLNPYIVNAWLFSGIKQR